MEGPPSQKEQNYFDEDQSGRLRLIALMMATGAVVTNDWVTARGTSMVARRQGHSGMAIA